MRFKIYGWSILWRWKEPPTIKGANFGGGNAILRWNLISKFIRVAIKITMLESFWFSSNERGKRNAAQWTLRINLCTLDRFHSLSYNISEKFLTLHFHLFWLSYEGERSKVICSNRGELSCRVLYRLVGLGLNFSHFLSCKMLGTGGYWYRIQRNTESVQKLNQSLLSSSRICQFLNQP